MIIFDKIRGLFQMLVRTYKITKLNILELSPKYKDETKHHEDKRN